MNEKRESRGTNWSNSLKDEGVEADVAWPTPIHLQPYYRQSFGFKEGDFPDQRENLQDCFPAPNPTFPHSRRSRSE